MRKDPWHYPRIALAEQYLGRFDPGPAQALTLFAERRAGKTSFLRHDLADAALRAALQPVYIDLWASRADPGRAIADGLEAATRRVKDPAYRYGSLLGRFGEDVASVGALGVSVSLRARPQHAGPESTLSRMTFWADQLVAHSSRPILLMIDEVQALAGAADGVDVASALRSILQQHGRLTIRPVFTGSSRDGLNRMFNQSNAAFFRFGASPAFPAPDDGIAEFFAARVRASSGIVIDPDALLEAFEALDRRPGPLRELVEEMDNAGDPDVPKYLQRQIGEMQAMASARADLARLKPVDVAVLEQIHAGAEIFGRAAKSYIAGRLGIASVNNKTLNDALNKLRAGGLVTRVDRGVYKIEDREVAALVAQSVPDDSRPQLELGGLGNPERGLGA